MLNFWNIGRNLFMGLLSRSPHTDGSVGSAHDVDLPEEGKEENGDNPDEEILIEPSSQPAADDKQLASHVSSLAPADGSITLVALLIDDSGSIEDYGNTSCVMSGHNEIIEDLRQAGYDDRVLVFTQYLNGTVINDFVPPSQAVLLDENNYCPAGGTPLYDMVVALLKAVRQKGKELANQRKKWRCLALSVTDGHDQHSRKYTTAEAIRPGIEQLWNTGQYIIGGMGINDDVTDFRRVFMEMGIPENWILTPRNQHKDINEAFHSASHTTMDTVFDARSFTASRHTGFTQVGSGT